jgi:hypothetical protein
VVKGGRKGYKAGMEEVPENCRESYSARTNGMNEYNGSRSRCLTVVTFHNPLMSEFRVPPLPPQPHGGAYPSYYAMVINAFCIMHNLPPHTHTCTKWSRDYLQTGTVAMVCTYDCVRCSF